MKQNQLAVRIGLLVLGILVTALGLSGMLIADLGQTPISSISVVLGEIFKLKTGDAMLYFNLACFVGEWITYGKTMRKAQFLQPLLALYFGLVVNLFLYDLPLFNALPSETYWAKLIMMVLGILIMNVGIAMVMVSDLVYFPFEGFAQAVATRIGQPFAKIKNIADILTAMSALILALIIRMPSLPLREGTVIFALLAGPLIGAMMKFIRKHLLHA